MKKIILIVLMALLSLTWHTKSHAQLSFWNPRVQIFVNEDCDKNDSCDLRIFKAVTEEYRVWVKKYRHLGTRLIASYETGSVDTLEKYGIVQFVRGCVFDSFVIDDVEIKIKNIYKWQFDEVERFSFPQWVIDSVDNDPIYNSYNEEDRHYFYRWNKFFEPIDPPIEMLYGEEVPIYPRLYVLDHPGTAFLWGGEARNISNEFKICIYKAADIPNVTTQDNINFATPIHCFSWRSSYIYNHLSKAYESRETLDPFCLDDKVLIQTKIK